MAVSDVDESFMREALTLAVQGRGRVEPNPMVGCVIVKDGRVIGRGYHQQYGAPHAEPNALAACTEDPAGATAYVTLEPCCHTNKQTPPCVPRLIAAKLARVIVGCADPNQNVSGKGVAQLQEAHIQTYVGCLEAETKQLVAPFFSSNLRKRPYVTLKWAQTANNAVGLSNERLQISNPTAMQVVHELRARCDAILVGINTVIADDPMLTVRGVEPMRPLLRVVLNRDLTIPLGSRLVGTARQTPLVIICGESAYQSNVKARESLNAAGAMVVGLPLDPRGRIDLAALLQHLGSMDVTHLLVEPGPSLARSFLAGNHADRVWVIRSPKSVQAGLLAAPFDFPSTGSVNLADDVLTEYLNPKSEVFFALEQSADLQLAARQ